jgi:hypothetical protein
MYPFVPNQDSYSDISKNIAPKSLVLFHQNIQGIRSKLSQIEIMLTTKNIDIMCFCETFLKAQDVQHFQIPGYKLADFYCRDKSRGGVCIYIKNSMNFVPLQCIYSLSVNKIFECCGIHLVEIDCIVICLYRTPDSDFNLFLKTLDCLLYKLTIRPRHAKRKIIIAGDLNVNILEDTPKCVILKNTLRKYNLNITIKEPTRITLQSKTCIDNIITNFKKYKSNVLHLGLSDHSAQMISIPCNKGYALKCWYIFKRNINKYIEIFLFYLSQLNFSEIYLYKDINGALNSFISSFKLLYDLCVPIEKIRVSFKRKSNWQTKSIHKSCRYKRNLHRKIMLTKRTNLIPYYKKYCKILKSVTRLAKKKYNISFINNSKDRNKSTWDLIKRQTTLQNNFKNTIEKVVVGSTTITNASTIAETFNDYFNNIIYDQNTRHYDLPNVHLQSIYLVPVDSEEVKKIILGLKNKKSYGYDNIPVQVIKASLSHISGPLVYLLNLMLETGVFPAQLKKAKIKPLFKKGCTSTVTNYRPISLLSCFSKIFEKVIYTRLSAFFDAHNILHKNQFGFQKDKSTILAIYKVLSEVWSSLNNRTKCVGLFLDMSKAFDGVIHDILLGKLERVGIRGLALSLLKSYLEDREQVTVIETFNKKSKTFEEVESDPIKVTIGLPQGSILGPLLFLIYINELPNITDHKCIMFADDATIFIQNRLNIDFNTDINNTLEKIVDWLKNINLNVNLTKTKIMQFKNYRSKSVTLDIKENNTKIEEVDNINFLGVEVDCHLDWKAHVAKINKRISSYCYALSILAETTSVEVTRAAYYGQVYPLLTYGIIFWGNSVNIQSTFILQKRCLRIIYNMYADETLRNVFRDKYYLTLTNIYILEIASFIKQNNDCFQNKSSLKKNLRSIYKYNIHVPRPHNNVYFKSSYYAGIKVFNHLPTHIKSLNLPRFKSKLKRWLLSNVFYNLSEYFDAKH